MNWLKVELVNIETGEIVESVNAVKPDGIFFTGVGSDVWYCPVVLGGNKNNGGIVGASEGW